MGDHEQGHPNATDKVAHLQVKVTQVKDIMQHNIEEVFDRGVALDKLDVQAKALDVQAKDYNRMAKDVRWKMWWQNMKLKLLILFILIVIGLIIWLSICKGFKC